MKEMNDPAGKKSEIEMSDEESEGERELSDARRRKECERR